MNKRKIVAVAVVVVLAVLAASVAYAFAVNADVEDGLVYETVAGDLYTGDHIVIRLHEAPDSPLWRSGFVYVDGENLGWFYYEFQTRGFNNEVVILIWK